MGHADEEPARQRWCRPHWKDLAWPDATVVGGDAVDVVAWLKEKSQVPLRSHGSLSMNRALMAAGLVDRVQVTLFPVITGQTADDPIFRVRPTSTSSSSRAGRSMATSKSSSTGPPCMPKSIHAPHAVKQPNLTRGMARKPSERFVWAVDTLKAEHAQLTLGQVLAKLWSLTGARGQGGALATFPTAGTYHLFLQFKVDGAVHTAAFTQEVSP